MGMRPSDSPGSRFDNFLFATLFETEHTSVSMLSALTRQGIDAWDEASCLDQLSKDDAVKRLALTIQKSANPYQSDPDAHIIAASLVARLPSHCSPSAQIAWEQNEGKVIMRLIYLYYAVVLVLIAISGSSYFEQPASKFNFFRASSSQKITADSPRAP
jgi:hypothetical protein